MNYWCCYILIKSSQWINNLKGYLSNRQTLADRYARERNQVQIPVKISRNKKIILSPGEHSELIRDIIEDFSPRFAPGSQLIYAVTRVANGVILMKPYLLR
jgi:hypothetical protein